MDKPAMITCLQDLIDHLGADSVTNLNPSIYESTECGASISVHTPDGVWHHNGKDWSGITEIDAFTIQTIVEGSDAEVNSSVFELPVDERTVDTWIETMEQEAAQLWREANPVKNLSEFESEIRHHLEDGVLPDDIPDFYDTEQLEELARAYARKLAESIPCLACGGKGYLIAAPEGLQAPEGFKYIKRCDTCCKYANDWEAAAATAQARLAVLVMDDANAGNLVSPETTDLPFGPDITGVGKGLEVWWKMSGLVHLSYDEDENPTLEQVREAAIQNIADQIATPGSETLIDSIEYRRPVGPAKGDA